MALKFDFKGLGEVFEADWPVTVPVPQDGGSVEDQIFTARFRLLDQETANGLMNGEDADAWINSFFVGLPGEQIPEGSTFEDVRKLMLARPYIRIALIKANSQFQAGISVKN